MTSRRGQILIASPRLRDPNFFKSVVLIVEDGEERTMGVILNRPMEITVADACGGQVELACAVAEPLHQGGPCEGMLTVLHGNPDGGGEQVVEGVRFSMDKHDIEWLMAHHTSGASGPIKYFAGYSGWGKGQLQSEIDEGAWLLVPAKSEHIFDKQGDWSKLSTWLAVGREIALEQIPDDPSLN